MKEAEAQRLEAAASAHGMKVSDFIAIAVQEKLARLSRRNGRSK